MATRKKKPSFKVTKIRNFSLNNRDFKIVWKNKPFKDGGCGECEEPSDLRENIIRIAPKAFKCQKKLLATLIDEATHAHWFMISNEDVSKFSDDLSDFLWEIGFRLPEKFKPLNRTD